MRRLLSRGKTAGEPVKEPEVSMTEEDEDLNEALSPIYDQLKLKRVKWRSLELVPITFKHVHDNGKRVRHWR